MIKIYKVIVALGSEELEECIAAMPSMEQLESVDDIGLIEEILEYDTYDYVIVNTLLSQRKTAQLAEFIEHSMEAVQKPKIMVLVEDLGDKKLIAQLVGLGVNVFVTFDELAIIPKYMENYPAGFDLSALADAGAQKGSKMASATKVISGTISIGVFNLDHGAGATTCSLKLAEEIADCGYRVVCVEIGEEKFQFVKSKNKNLERISTAEKEKDAVLQVAFSDPHYQFIVIDFGKLFEFDIKGNIHGTKKDSIGDFLRCNYKVGMCFASPWHTPKLELFLKNDFFQGDLMKNQLFLLVSGQEAQESIEDYHELPLFDREEGGEGFLLHFKSTVGLTSAKGAQKRRRGLFKKKGWL